MDKISGQDEFLSLCDRTLRKEPKFEPVIRDYGYPPLWYRTPNFSTLILTILEQQISLAAAKAAYNKLVEKIGDITPEAILKLSDEELRECYFSRQKTEYVRKLTTEITTGKLDLGLLNRLDEPEIRARLIRLKGIGNWTVDMYVLMSLHFADIFPSGDLATVKAVIELDLVNQESSKEDIVLYMKKFSPYQSVATYILWHNYIESRNLILE